MKAKEDIKKFIKERERFYEFLDEEIQPLFLEVVGG